MGIHPAADHGQQANLSATGPRTLAFRAADGFPLSGTLFEGGGNGPLVLISSATAVLQRLYFGFAAHLVEQGARGVLTYDYRATAPRRNQPIGAAAYP
jgi:predicted alpha/beta hydrolase